MVVCLSMFLLFLSGAFSGSTLVFGGVSFKTSDQLLLGREWFWSWQDLQSSDHLGAKELTPVGFSAYLSKVSAINAVLWLKNQPTFHPMGLSDERIEDLPDIHASMDSGCQTKDEVFACSMVGRQFLPLAKDGGLLLPAIWINYLKKNCHVECQRKKSGRWGWHTTLW